MKIIIGYSVTLFCVAFSYFDILQNPTVFIFRIELKVGRDSGNVSMKSANYKQLRLKLVWFMKH